MLNLLQLRYGENREKSTENLKCSAWLAIEYNIHLIEGTNYLLRNAA